MGQRFTKRFYTLTHLPPTRYEVSGETLEVDLREPDDLPRLHDDHAFRSYLNHEGLYWVSGGGSVLFNRRYLAVVERGADALVNPGMLSLFTGRSDGPAEWEDPSLLMRELLEELIIVDGDILLRPSNPLLDRVAGGVYDRYSHLLPTVSEPLKLEKVSAQRKVVVHTQGDSYSLDLDFHINSRNDCNILSIFEAERDIQNLKFLDGENLLSRGPARKIHLLDIKSGTLVDGDDHRSFDPSLCTEHLTFVIELLRGHSYYG